MAEKTVTSAACADLPSAYQRWRGSWLGRVTDTLEQDLVLDLVGPVAGLRVLDVGCGDGQLALALAQGGASVSAIDVDKRMLAAARRRFETAAFDVELQEGDAQALPFETGSFDVVTAVTVLCFMSEPERALAEMVRVLRPGGRMVIGELARYSSWAAWRRLRGWLGHATWRVARFRTGRELSSLATSAGLSVRAVRAAAFYPPFAPVAAALAPLDAWLGRHFITGGAFIALLAIKR